MSGRGSLAWSAPEGDREGRASAGWQELGEGDRGRWHKAKTHSTFLTKGRKNSFLFFLLFLPLLLPLFLPPPLLPAHPTPQVVAQCSQDTRSVLQPLGLPSRRIQHLLIVGLWESHFHVFLHPTPKESVE